MWKWLAPEKPQSLQHESALLVSLLNRCDKKKKKKNPKKTWLYSFNQTYVRWTSSPPLYSTYLHPAFIWNVYITFHFPSPLNVLHVGVFFPCWMALYKPETYLFREEDVINVKKVCRNLKLHFSNDIFMFCSK